MVGRSGDRGSTSAIGFAVAAGLFAISFTAANLMVEKPAARDHRGPELDASATTALDVVVSGAGLTTSGGAWADAPDALDRFGLATAGKENFLDYRKIKSMRNATMTSSVNNAPDYPDVREALGMDGDFHLRTYPVLPGYDDPRWTKEPYGRYAYVAHDLGTNNPPGQATVTTFANTSGNTLNVSVAIRNDGATPYLFSATVSLGKISTGSQLVDEQRHTRLLAPGEVQTLWVEFPRMAYSGSPDGVRVLVADAMGTAIHGPTWTAATLPSSGTTHTVGVKVTAGARYYISGESVTFHADRYDNAGDIPNAAVDWVFVLLSPTGTELYNDTIPLKKKKSGSFVCNSCTAEGVYTGFFYNSPKTGFAPTLRARDIVHVVAAAPSSGAPVFSGIAGEEIDILQKLVKNFNPTLYDASANPTGDIFDDSRKVRDLPAVLDRYSSLVIGSGVSQTSLNSGDIKWGIADWVIEGGNLVVLGRESGHANWLQPVYKASISSASGGIGAPDPTHPVLSAPNRLDYKRYNDAGLAWGIEDGQPFTHVLTKGPAGNEHQDALAIANPGAYRDGSVVLTSYMPGALTTPQDGAEAARFMHNLLSQSYNMLFLDFGPPVPDDKPVGAAQRLVAVPHPNVPGAVVEVRIVMYAWT